MRKFSRLVVFLVLFAGLWPVLPTPALAGSDPMVLVNEFYRGGDLNTGDEWIELVVAQDLTAAQLEGFYVGDSTSSTAAKYSGYNFTGMSGIAANFPKGTIIVVGGSAAFSEDTSYDPASGDWSFFLNTAGSYVTSNGSNGNLATTDVVYVDTNGTNGDTTLSADGFAVNWDSSPGTFGSAADVTISAPANNTGVVLTSGVVGASNPANWSTSVASSSLTPGDPNGGNNSTYVTNLRAALAAQFTIAKSAPSAVMVGDVFTYTLVTDNSTGGVLTNVVITDSLPLSVTVLSVSDGGVALPGNVVSWTVASLADGTAVTRTVNVAAPAANTQLVNADYAAASPDWATPAVGAPVNTDVVGELVDVGDARDMGGEIVTLSGRATMYTGGFYAGGGNTKFYVQDATGGIAVQCFGSSGSLPVVTLGDLVTVTGRIGAYHSEVQIVPHDNVADVNVVDGTPADVPAPVDVALADFNSPDTPAWLTRVQGQAVRVQEYSFSYAVDISDGVDTVSVYVDKGTGIDMSNVLPYHYYAVTGIAEAHYSDFELKPRIQADFVEITPAVLMVHKEAPGLVVSGTVYTYTIVATNNTTATLSNLMITDTVPAANAQVAAVMDGGVLVSGTITWTISSLAAGADVEARFAMTATGSAGSVITNANYAAWADEWTIPAHGPAVETTITAGCDPGDTPIYAVQGSGDASPLAGTQVTICGVVMGVSSGLRGFFLQDPDGDGDIATSDGIFVYRSSQPFGFLQVGDLVEVHGQVDEYYGLTRLRSTHSSDALTVLAEDIPTPPAAALNPPADRTAADAYLETFEGMLVAVPVTVTVVGPTNHFGEYYVVRGDTGVTRLVRNTNPPDGYRLGVDDGLVLSDDYVVGDVLSGLYGPLHFTYDNWKIEQAHQPTVVSLADVPDALPQYPHAGTYSVTVGAFNTLNFDGQDNDVKLTKVVSSIIALGPPTFLSLEEITVVDTWHYFDNYTVTGVISDVLGGLAAAGYNYDYAYSHADGGGHGVAVLYDTDVVQLDGVATLQGCSAVGSGSASNYDHFCDAVADNPLFSRRPVVVTGTLNSTVPPTQITFIGAHLKSGFGDPDDIQRRLEQAQLIAGYVSGLTAAGQGNVVVAGDMNDFLGSQTLAALETSGTLTDTFYTLPPEARYSYVYNGGSQVLDHILASPAMFATMADFQPLHIDADYPAGWEIDADEPFGVSDHDPVVSTFALEEPAVVTIDKAIVGRSGAGSGTLLYGGGMVTYTITLSNTSAVDALNVALTDTLPAQVLFDAWVENAAGAVEAGNTITWTGTVSATTEAVFTFRATVLPHNDTVLLPVVNTATFTADNALGGEDAATFDLGVWRNIFLPLVMKNHTP